MKHKVINWLRLAGIILGCGVALALPFTNYHYGWFGFVALLPLLFALEWLEGLKWKRWRKIAMLYGIGLVFFGIIVQWMYHIHATDLIADSALRLAFIILSFFLVASSLALGFIVFGQLYFRLKLSLKKGWIFVLLPAAWIVGEFARSILFSIMWLGPGGTVGPHWNFGNFSFAASATPLVYAARLLGMFGLSVAVVLMNLSLYMLIKRRYLWQSMVCIVAVLVLAGSGYLLYAKSVNPKIVRVGVTHLQSDADTGYEADVIKSMASQMLTRANALILPEYSHFYEPDNEPSVLARQKTIARSALGPDQAKGVIITSQLGQGEYQGGNGVIYMRQNGNVLSTQYKRFLIPAGEYVPYAFQVILKLSGNGGVVSAHQTKKTIVASKKSEHFVMVDGVRFGAMACSGVISPELYRGITKSGAEVLTNSASLSSMGIDKLYFQEAKQMARFQAVANARAFVQSARGGESYAISKDGEYIAETRGDKTQYLQTSVTTNARRTLYSLAGEWVLVLAFAALGIQAFTARARPKPPHISRKKS